MNRRNFLKGLIALPAVGSMPLNLDPVPEKPIFPIRVGEIIHSMVNAICQQEKS